MTTKLYKGVALLVASMLITLVLAACGDNTAAPTAALLAGKIDLKPGQAVVAVCLERKTA